MILSLRIGQELDIQQLRRYLVYLRPEKHVLGFANIQKKDFVSAFKVNGMGEMAVFCQKMMTY
jgi:hypothetical protein